MDKTLSGNIIDITNKRIFKGSFRIEKGRIMDMKEVPEADNVYILPGFIDAHIHIESSMLIPSEFARMAVVHGTVGTVSDPHEIANVCGIEGVDYMIRNGATVPFKFNFGAPSCVPATTFESAGATIDANDIDALLQRKEIKYLAEMMNWPGVLYQDATVYQKIAIAKRYGKVIDGHAPGLKGQQARTYAAAGISTDHECFSKEEALDKLACGMKIIIREGSAAKNFDALIDLLHDHEDQIMFCSDDKHPDELVIGHIDQLVKRALAKGIDLFKVLKAACINPIGHYGLDIGALKEGDPADLIVVDDLDNFRVLETYIDGILVAQKGQSLIERNSSFETINNFNTFPINHEDLSIKKRGVTTKIIEALDGQLITRSFDASLPEQDGYLQPDLGKDILKIVVVNRYRPARPAVAFIKGFGFREGAIASSIAHDSHNIIAVGVDDVAIAHAVNEVIRHHGGIATYFKEVAEALPLPIAGLMSGDDGHRVAADYTRLSDITKTMGSPLSAPFMTLSFMALLVIPALKLSDLGLFDGESFKFVETIDQEKKSG